MKFMIRVGTRTIAAFVVVLSACTSSTSRWSMSAQCLATAPINSSYQVVLIAESEADQGSERFQYSEIHRWQDDKLSIVGVNPLGIVLFQGQVFQGQAFQGQVVQEHVFQEQASQGQPEEGTLSKSEAVIEHNPMYRQYDFSLITQMILATQQSSHCKQTFLQTHHQDVALSHLDEDPNVDNQRRPFLIFFLNKNGTRVEVFSAPQSHQQAQ